MFLFFLELHNTNPKIHCKREKEKPTSKYTKAQYVRYMIEDDTTITKEFFLHFHFIFIYHQFCLLCYALINLSPGPRGSGT